MAGHSQFKNIMHRKAAQDKKKAKVYTKLIRDIMTAARSGGGDLNSNPSLRASVEKARKENMTKDVVERAIKRGTGEIQGADYQEKVYEGYAPGGVAVIVKALTDNPTRTIPNIRTAFAKNGGNVGSEGSVAWMFRECGQITYPAAIGSEDAVMEAAILAGAEDVQSDESLHTILTAVADFGSVRDELTRRFGEPQEADLTHIATQTQEVTNLEIAQSIVKLIEQLEADDDVQNVTTNLTLPEEISAKL